jgi:hypothetical protein
VSAATSLDYAGRCERYARQAGWEYAVNRISIGHLTPRQRRRALKKEDRANRGELTQEARASFGGWPCDVCGLPDPYQGTGDGIGSCGCPRCECGEAAHSAFCTCPPDDYYDPDDDERDFDEEIRAELQARHDALVTGLERRFLGDLDGWKPTGLLPSPQPTATEQET